MGCTSLPLSYRATRSTGYIEKKGSYGADQTEKIGAFRAERTIKVVPLELIELGKWVHSGKVGAFRAYLTKSRCIQS